MSEPARRTGANGVFDVRGLTDVYQKGDVEVKALRSVDRELDGSELVSPSLKSAILRCRQKSRRAACFARRDSGKSLERAVFQIGRRNELEAEFQDGFDEGGSVCTRARVSPQAPRYGVDVTHRARC